MKKIIAIIATTVGGVGLALAQNIQQPQVTGSVNSTGSAIGSSLLGLIALAQEIINRSIPLLIGAAVAALFIGIVMFLWKGRESEEEHTKWGKFMGMAVLALFVMVSIWGLVNFLGSVLNIGQGGGVPTPGIPVRPNTY